MEEKALDATLIGTMVNLFPRLCKSRSDARRLIEQGAVKLNSTTVKDPKCHCVTFSNGELGSKSGYLTLNSKWETNDEEFTEFLFIQPHTNATDTWWMISVGKKNHGIIKLTL